MAQNRYLMSDYRWSIGRDAARCTNGCSEELHRSTLWGEPTAALGRKRLASVQSAGHLLTKQLALRPFGSAFELRVRQGRTPGPWPPTATLGDVQLSQTLTELSAREREVSPSPFIPTRRWALAEPPCTPWQPIQLGPKRGLPLSGHSKAGTTRRLSLHPVRRLRR